MVTLGPSVTESKCTDEPRRKKQCRAFSTPVPEKFWVKGLRVPCAYYVDNMVDEVTHCFYCTFFIT